MQNVGLQIFVSAKTNYSNYIKVELRINSVRIKRARPVINLLVKLVVLSQGLLGLCCSIETRDHIEIITITAVLFE